MTDLNNDIIRIRQMLRQYYAGSTSPEEQDELRAFFSSADRAKLPSDLLADATLFDALQNAGTENTPPPELAADICSHIFPKKENKRRNAFAYAMLGAAAAIVILLLAVPPMDYTTPNFDARDAALKLSAVTNDGCRIAKPDTAAPAAQPVPSPKTRRSYRHCRHNIARNIAAETPEPYSQSTTVEITSPEKARKITLRTLRMVSSAIRISTAGVNTVEHNIYRLSDRLPEAKTNP